MLSAILSVRVLLLAAGIALAASGPSAAQDGSVTDLVDECDVLAAHPGDPERMSDGLADDAIVPRLAIMACEAAARRAPADARFSFQLGRAYLAAGRHKEAAEEFRNAADRGYGAALGYLGDAYQFGHGVEADIGKALDAYRRALAKGFAAAESQIEMLTFDPAIFVVPAVGLLYSGDLQSFRGADTPQLRAYLFSFVMALGGECGTVLKPKAVEALYNRRYPKTWKPDDDATVSVTIMDSIAEYDAGLFLRRHGCEGPAATRLKDQLNRLLLES